MSLVWRYVRPVPWTAAGLLLAGLIGLLGGRWHWRKCAGEAHSGVCTSMCQRLPRTLLFDAIHIDHMTFGMDAPH